MKQTIIDKPALKAKGEALGVPFSAVLEAYVAEAFRYLLAESEFADLLWIKNAEQLKQEQWGKRDGLTLEFAYLTDARAMKKNAPVPGQELSLKMGYVMLAYILKKEKTPEIKWRGRAAMHGERLELVVAGEFEEMTVPLVIHVTAMEDESAMPVRREYPLLLRGGGSIVCPEYPTGNILTEKLAVILRDMELLQDMEAYDTVYRLLRNESVEGRCIAEQLLAAFRQAEIVPTEERLSELLSYRDYPYMRKRWKKYLRGRKRQGPEWDEVIELLAQFLPHIWESVCRDEVFLGDWMPELCRFLD